MRMSDARCAGITGTRAGVLDEAMIDDAPISVADASCTDFSTRGARKPFPNVARGFARALFFIKDVRSQGGRDFERPPQHCID